MPLYVADGLPLVNREADGTGALNFAWRLVSRISSHVHG